jgi:hypothetical protein
LSSSPPEIEKIKKMVVLSGQNQILQFAKPDSLIFSDRTKIENREDGPSGFNQFFSPFVIKHQKGVVEVFKRALLIIFTFFSACFVVFIILRISRRRGVKRRGVCVGWTSLFAIPKSKFVEACVTVPLLHQVLYFKERHHFFKGLHLQAFFAFRGNGRARGLKV